MTMVFDKNRYKLVSETDRIKIKNGFPKNSNKHKYDKNSSLYKEYVISSPYKDIIKNKKISYINLYQNNNKISNYNNNYNNLNNNNQNNNKKILSNKKMKYNKSFELNMNKNIMPNVNLDILNDNLYTINNNKHKISNNINNNSVILNNKIKRIKNKNKSMSKSGNTYRDSKPKSSGENMLIKKLDENFLSLESNIIDQKYENDIDHDEMIISSNKKSKNNFNKEKNNSNKLSDIIGLNSNNKDINDIEEDLFLNIYDKKTNFEIDENYLLNSSFENQRSDFSIMYTDDYEKTVMDDLLSLEIKLLVEKMLEIQKSYHKELNLILSQYNKNGAIFKLLIEKISFYRKKMHNLQKLKEKRSTKENIYNFLGIHHKNNKQEINQINKSEFNLWNNALFGKIRKNKIFDKEKLRQMFKYIVFDKYYKLSGKMNNVENKIILELMKKFKFNKNSEIKANNSNVKSNVNKTYKTKSNKNNSTSPLQIFKNTIKKNRNNSNGTYNKNKHKKFSSSSQPKQPNFYIFKIKQK